MTITNLNDKSVIKNFERLGPTNHFFCSYINVAWVVWTIIGGWETQILLAMFELYALSGIENA